MVERLSTAFLFGAPTLIGVYRAALRGLGLIGQNRDNGGVDKGLPSKERGCVERKNLLNAALLAIGIVRPRLNLVIDTGACHLERSDKLTHHLHMGGVIGVSLHIGQAVEVCLQQEVVLLGRIDVEEYPHVVERLDKRRKRLECFLYFLQMGGFGLGCFKFSQPKHHDMLDHLSNVLEFFGE